MQHSRFLLLAVALLSAPAVRASVVLDLPIEELSRRAVKVVHGTVASQEVLRDEDGRIVTETTLRVAETLKGKSERTVVVRQVGGARDGLAQHVEGTPAFNVGDEAVLFLEKQPAREGTFVPVALSLAAYRVKLTAGAKRVFRDLTGLSLARHTAQGLQIYPPPVEEPAETLGDFKRRVRALVRSAQ